MKTVKLALCIAAVVHAQPHVVGSCQSGRFPFDPKRIYASQSVPLTDYAAFDFQIDYGVSNAKVS